MIVPELVVRSRKIACAAVTAAGLFVTYLSPAEKKAAAAKRTLAVPEAVLPPLDRPVSPFVAARLRPKRRVTLGSILKLLFAVIVASHIALVLVIAEFSLIYSRVDPPVNSLMAYRAIFFHWTIQPPRPIPLKSVPRQVRNMLVWIEDGGFYENRGIEFAAIKRAYEINKRLKYPLYGGSTLTMQLARTLFLTPEKSYLRKYVEIWIAVEMDALLSKTRIIELYFNNVEWGKGVFGIQAASYRYFKRPLSELSVDEQVRLITILSSPVKYSPYNFGRSKILNLRYEDLADRYD